MMKRNSYTILLLALARFEATESYSINTYNRYVNGKPAFTTPEAATASSASASAETSSSHPTTENNQQLHPYCRHLYPQYNPNAQVENQPAHFTTGTPPTTTSSSSINQNDNNPAGDIHGSSGGTTNRNQQNTVVIGDKYVLVEGDPKQSSGKSNIYEAFPQDERGQPVTSEQETVIVKLSPNTEALQREAQNYNKITSSMINRITKVDSNDASDSKISASELFVQVHDYLEQADPSNQELKDQAALVMERGAQDLKTYIEEHGPLQGKELQNIVKAVVKCVKAVHKSNMVWTEIKSQNFVVTGSGAGPGAGDKVKGIDLESAVPHMNKPIDYSPEAVPPEFAIAYLCGREPSMEMEYNFDIWSLGMLLHEIATGTHYFEGESQVDVATRLKNKGPDGMQRLLNEIQDLQLRDLVAHCLQIDPAKRPTIQQVAQHPYFTSAQ